MMKNLKYWYLLICLVFGNGYAYSQEQMLNQDNLSFKRENMQFDDDQVLLFSGRGFVCPCEYSMTSFTNVEFLPIALHNYNFCIHLKEESTNTLIRDDIPADWKTWADKGQGWDPLATNFRSYAPKAVVTQDEVWKPNLYTRKGTFYKVINNKVIKLGLKSATCVSSQRDEVLIRYEISNRDAASVSLVLIPAHLIDSLPCSGETGSPKIKVSTPFKVASEQMQINVASNIPDHTEEGYRVTIQPHSTAVLYFSVSFAKGNQPDFPLCQSDLSARFETAQRDIQEKLQWASSRLPMLTTDNKLIRDLYYRSLLSVLMCRNERENLVIHPFWSVGTWPFTISWDNSYASDILAMLEPNSLKETIRLNLERGQMKKTYIAWDGNMIDILYIQEPFAIQLMLNAYMNHTGDISILNEKAGDKTIYEWMVKWAEELHNHYGRSDGLIDIGYSTEKIIEIRTDGYNHVVPVLNGLTTDLYGELSRWASLLGKSKDQKKFLEWKTVIQKAFLQKMWNKDEQWFDNLYPDGTKGQVYTYHLFDLLASPNITGEQRVGLVSHIKEHVFLGKFGFYSIAKNDTIHWDRADCDWGGGGQYAGMPSRIARNLYNIGFPQLGWDVLKRYAGYTNYFPYFSQNPSADKPKQDRSSMPLEISAGSAAEALIFGTFGVRIGIDSIRFAPNYHEDLGHSTLTNIHWRNHLFDVKLNERNFEIFEDSRKIGEGIYGNSITISAANQSKPRYN
jgi:hypothetical protein